MLTEQLTTFLRIVSRNSRQDTRVFEVGKEITASHSHRLVFVTEISVILRHLWE